MVALARSQSLKLPVAAGGGMLAGILVAATAFAVPATMEQILAPFGIVEPDTLSRTILALAAGIALGAVVWALLVLTVGTHLLFRRNDGRFPALHPDNAHPDAPTPRPLRAIEELGPPLDQRASAAVKSLPEDLDQPMFAYDPAAIPVAPCAPSRAVAPLSLPPIERLETFALTPSVPLPNEPSQTSVAHLLDRLERGARLHPRRPNTALEKALEALREAAAAY